jgi:ABC-type bacteriocin/lantibiotic exporter with double-glycine peptidase domain
VLLVSHRFSTVRLADAVYVLENGRVVQQGSHEQLVQQPGQYAQAYLSQLRGYRDYVLV